MTSGERPIGEDDIEAFIDGRLAPERAALVARHVAQDAGLADRVAADRRLGEQARARLSFKHAEPIPARLRIASVVAERRRRRRRRLAAAAVAAAWIAVGALGGWMGHDLASGERAPAPARSDLAGDANAAYRVYTAEIAHPVEVTRAQEAHLVQWLSRRLGQPLAAPDLGQAGFRLMGGRLLPAGTGLAAQFMYDDESGQRLTLYLRSGSGSETAFQFVQDGDVTSLSWIDRGLGFVISAKLPRDRLTAIAGSVHGSFERNAPAERRL